MVALGPAEAQSGLVGRLLSGRLLVLDRDSGSADWRRREAEVWPRSEPLFVCRMAE